MADTKAVDEAKERLERCAREKQTRLDLAGLKLGPEDAHELASRLPNCGALSTIIFGAGEISQERPEQWLAEMNVDMAEADFSSSKLRASGAIILAAFLPKCKALMSLNISSNNIGGWRDHVDVPADSKVGDAFGEEVIVHKYPNPKMAQVANHSGIKALADSVKNNGALEKLLMGNNQMATKEAGKALAAALAANTTLKELDVSSNNWQEYGDLGDWMGDGPGFANEVADGIKNNGALTSLNVSANSIGTIVGWTHHPGNVRTYKYEHSDGRHQEHLPEGDELGKPEGVIAIANAIPTMGALTSLNLASNDLKAEGAKHVAEAIKVHGAMETLNISDNELGAGGAKHIAAFIPECKSLSSLDISKNRIEAEGAKLLAEALLLAASRTSLVVHLDLSSNEIDDDKECRNLFVRLAIKQPSFLRIDFAHNNIRADAISLLCDDNHKHQADQLVCHCLCEKLAHTLQQVSNISFPDLQEYKDDLEQLIDDKDFDPTKAEDEQGRTLLAIAEGVSKNSDLSNFIRTKTLFLGIYKIARGDPAHKSATCIVSFAEDYSGDAPVPVALKFMRNADEFAREIKVRKEQDLEKEFVVGVMRCYSSAIDAGADSDADRKQLAIIQDKLALESANIVLDSQDAQRFANAIRSTNHGIYQEYRFCLVLPRATRGLHEVITHDHIAGIAERILDVKALMLQTGEALLHLHEKGVIHADLKPLNVMYAEGRWKLIDLDAAATIGAGAGLKSSTGYVPPELLIIEGDTARVRKPDDDTERLIAREAFDIWSFGVLLFLLVCSEPLFKNNQEDNLSDDEVYKLASWDSKQLDKALLKVHNKRKKLHRPLERDLLQKLLAPDATHRPDSFEEVLDHAFFTGEDESTKEIMKRMEEMHTANMAAHERTQEEQARQTKLLESVESRQIEIKDASDRTLAQLVKTERVLLRGMFEATEVTIPTSFIIVPVRLEPKSEQLEGTAPLLQLAEDGSGVELSSAGEEMRVEVEKRAGWFNQVCSLGDKIRKALAGDGDGLVDQLKESAVDFVKEKLQDEPMWLYLIDEYTGEPVVPDADDSGPYPIEITTPSNMAVKLLPIMRTGLKVMSVVNGAALVGNMIGLPVPRVPEKWQEKANEAVGSLDKKNSVAEYDVLQSSVDGASDGDGGSKEKIRGATLREYERFLLEKDEKHLFAGLNRLVTPEGQACWTLLTAEEVEDAATGVVSTEERLEAAAMREAETRQREAEANAKVEELRRELETAATDLMGEKLAAANAEVEELRRQLRALQEDGVPSTSRNTLPHASPQLPQLSTSTSAGPPCSWWQCN